MSLHPMLLRQLERSGWKEGDPPSTPEQWNNLLKRISHAYTEADQERYLLSRSQDLASNEIEEICLRLTEAQRIAGLGDWNFNLQNDTGQWSDGCIHIFGLACTSLTPSYSNFLACLDSADREKFTAAVDTALVQGDSFEIDFQIPVKNRDNRWVHANVQPIPNPEGKAFRIRGTAMDITERKRAERGMELIQFVMENASVNITFLDANARIRYVNKAACETLGYTKEELLGMSIPDIDPFFPSDVWDEHWKKLKNCKTGSFETKHQRKNGEIFPVEVTAKYIEFAGKAYHVAFDSDVSERKYLEEQLLQSQKMEAIGTLVGGIAHDFNNMLAGIMGNTYLAKMHAADIPKLLNNIETIDTLSNQAAEMVRQLLTFARKDRVKMQSLSAASFLKEAVKLACTAIPANIECLCETPSEDMRIHIDPTQLQQVIMNLMNNAKDAVENIRDGKIICSLKPYSADMDFRLRYPTCEGHEFACLSISDNGCGIRKEVMDRVFEPFFTTKEVDKGTGLGLAMVYGAVQNHQGAIEVESVFGQGTAFNIYLPLAPVSVSSEAEEETVPSFEPAMGQSELILIVDDEEQLREVIKAVLQKLGYRVLTAVDGMAAVKLYKEHANQIDLVILDVVMPKMGGVEAARLIRQSNPRVPIMFATGYDKEQALKAQQEVANSLVLNKPFSVESLSQTIKQLLDS